MVLETVGRFLGGEFLTGLFEPNTIVLIALLALFIIVAYKIFKTLLKAVMVGTIAALFPVAANLMGYNIPITLPNIIWFGLAGVGLFLVYTIISGGVKIIKLIFSPLKLLFREKPKQKVILKEKKSK